MQRLEDNSTPVGVSMAILGYSLCSSTLLLANKMAIEHLPVPSVVSFIQIFSSTVIILLIKCCGVQVDNLEWGKVKSYSIYIVAFVAAIYANMQALAHSNVETVIVFRACSPIAVSIVEYLFLNRAWPSVRSSISLVCIVVGAILYCLSDAQLPIDGMHGYKWAILYFLLITFEMTWGKKLASSVPMTSLWGPVLYCNLLSSLLLFVLGFVSGDFVDIHTKLWNLPIHGIMIIFFSCVVGTMIGYVNGIPYTIFILCSLLCIFLPLTHTSALLTLTLNPNPNPNLSDIVDGYVVV